MMIPSLSPTLLTSMTGHGLAYAREAAIKAAATLIIFIGIPPNLTSQGFANDQRPDD